MNQPSAQPQADTQGQTTPAGPKRHADDAVLRMLLPVGRSWVAVVAGYAGLFAVLMVPAPLALGLGIWAVYHLKQHPELHGMGRAIFAIVMGALFSVVLVLALVSRGSTG